MSEDRILFTRTLSGLVATPGPAQEWLQKIKLGTILSIEKPKQPRNGKQLKLYWSLVKVVYDNLPEGVTYADTEDLSNALKIAVGHCKVLQLPNGKIERQALSISYKNMPQDKFDSFLTAVIGVVIKHWLPSVTEDELRQQAEQMLGLGFMGHVR